MPALFTRMSRRPRRLAASSTIARQARSSVTSATSATAPAPSAFSEAAFLSSSRPAIATVAPAAARPCAMPRPMPPLPPVTSAALPCSWKFSIAPPRADYGLLDKSKYPGRGSSMSHVDAVRRFNRFYTRRIGVLQSSYLGLPFPLPQARVLYEIGQRRECTASELGADLDIDLGYLSRLLQGLKRERLVQGERASHDARQVRLGLTPKGPKAVAAPHESPRPATRRILAPPRGGGR